MKICYLFLIPILLISCSPKEIPSNQLNERKNIYYEINSETPFSGATLEYHPNGQIKYKKNYSEGKLYGLSEKFYDNGQLEYQKNYKDNVLHGPYKLYRQNGFLWDSRIYENNEAIVTDYYDTGELKGKLFFIGEYSLLFQSFGKSGLLQMETKRIENYRSNKIFYETGELASEHKQFGVWVDEFVLDVDGETFVGYKKDGSITYIRKCDGKFCYTQEFVNSTLQEETCLEFLQPVPIDKCNKLIAREY